MRSSPRARAELLLALVVSALLVAPSVRADPGAAEGRWSLQLAAGAVADSGTHGVLFGDRDRASDASGGRLFGLGASFALHRFDIRRFGMRIDPELELQGSLMVVDERSRRPFVNPRGVVGLRWNDFPWSDVLPTTVFAGGGLSWSAKVWRIDREKHPSQHRSRLKFIWPIEISVALPQLPRQQLVFYSHHQSGGDLFDDGGFESYGIAFRHRFE